MTEDAGKLILRSTLGVLILFHGVGKVINGPDAVIGLVQGAGLPSLFAYLVYLGEVIAPLFLIAGFWTRPAAVVVAGNMVVAVLLVHLGDIFALTPGGGWALELQALYLFTAVAVALLGAGRFSLGGINGRWN